MMKIIKATLLASISCCILGTGSIFAASGSSTSVNTESGTAISTKKAADIPDAEKVLNTIDTEKKAQKLILDVYKIQGNKIIKDIDQSLEKVNPDPKIRIEAYTSIQKTLELRKQKLESSELSDTAREIIIGYIDHMIYTLEQRKNALRQ